MKTIIALLSTAFILSASAHNIEGTLVLKGTIKTKIMVNNLKTTCKVKVEKVKNLMLEDSFGNPAYNVRLDINLSGNDYERNLSVKFDRDFWVNNLFSTNSGSMVKDLEYASEEGTQMLINRQGRIKSVSFPFNGRQINCAF